VHSHTASVCRSAGALATFARVEAFLSALELRQGVRVGSLRMLPLVSEFAAALFEMPRGYAV
jgi:hypothetical protein